jgi:hypothetical protein
VGFECTRSETQPVLKGMPVTSALGCDSAQTQSGVGLSARFTRVRRDPGFTAEAGAHPDLYWWQTSFGVCRIFELDRPSSQYFQRTTIATDRDRNLDIPSVDLAIADKSTNPQHSTAASGLRATTSIRDRTALPLSQVCDHGHNNSRLLKKDTHV